MPRFDRVACKRLLRWSGLALFALGIVILGVLLLLGLCAGNGLAVWLWQEMLAPARILPLIGLGVAFGSVSAASRLIGLFLAAAGVVVGFWLYKPLLQPLWIIPRAAENRFLTGPMLALAAGTALVFANRWRQWLLPPFAFTGGIALTLGIVVSDPSVNDPTYSLAGVLVALCITTCAALCARGLQGCVLDIASRIFGSWLLAIGLLYGAAAFSKRSPNLPDLPPPSRDGSANSIGPPSADDVMPPQ